MKDTWTKLKWVRTKGGRWGWVGGSGGGKMETTALKQQ